MKKNINAALLAKQNKSLDIKMNYSGMGIMTRRDWLKLMNVKGWEAEEKQVPSVQWNRHKFNSMNYEEQQEYERKLDTKKTEYRLVFKNNQFESSIWVITKTEYDYFKNLQLAEDKSTEAMELTYKIEAGTATDEEIEQDEQKEFEFFNKYATE